MICSKNSAAALCFLERAAVAPPPAMSVPPPDDAGGGANLVEMRKRHTALRLRISRALNFERPREPFPRRLMPPRGKREPLAEYVERVEQILFDRPRSAVDLSDLLRELAERRRARP
ncbi:MAG: hypothetical protein U1E37_02745 [Sphingomonadaceae bacterium]